MAIMEQHEPAEPCRRVPQRLVLGTLCVRLLCAACVLLTLSVPVRAQQGYLSRLNESYEDIFPGEDGEPGQRTDMALLPVVARMDPLPPGLDTDQDAALAHPMLTPEVWDAARAWAEAPAQREVLDAILELGDPERVLRMGWGQPYGIESLEQIDLVSAGLYSEVPDSLLGATNMRYLDGLDAVHRLVHVEASRRLLEGDAIGSMEVLHAWLLIVNQLIEREFAHEKRWAMERMIDLFERLRDIGYQDFKGDRTLGDRASLIRLVELLEPLRSRRDGGALRLERVAPPLANSLSARQLAEVLLDADGADEDRFARTVGRMMSEGNPLRMFSELPRARLVASIQFGEPIARRLIDGMIADLELRWNSAPFDPIWQTRSNVERMQDTLGFGLVAAFSLLDVVDLFDLRRRVELERIGTRHSLALLGHSLDHMIPPNAFVAAPRWIDEVENDPYNPLSAEREATAPLEYIYLGNIGRASAQQRVHTVAVIPENAPRFERRFDRRDFLLYSVGTDGADDGGEEIQNTEADVIDADYLVWPPVISLLRQHLIDLRAGG